MSENSLAPTPTAPAALGAVLRERGYAVLDAASVCALSHCDANELNALKPYWNDLPPDAFLKDNGRYRYRRHSCFVLQGNQITQSLHRAHWQPLDYNALHGGMHRMFEPMAPALVAQHAWQKLLSWLATLCSELRGEQTWFAEAHQFRIDTANGIGRPTPEGAHRDGVDLVAVFLLAREGVKGGETRVFDAHGTSGERFTLSEPWSVLLLDDARVIHETTPIQPLGLVGYRDTLVVTLRANAFQGE